MIETLKKYYEAVDLIQKAGAFVIWLLGIAAGFQIISSRTLAIVLAAGACLGGLAGYFFSVAWWSGEGRGSSVRRSKFHFALGLASLLLPAALLSLVDSEFAANFPALRSVSQFLIAARLLTDLMAGLSSFLVLFLLISAIALSSPKLWDSPPPAA